MRRVALDVVCDIAGHQWVAHHVHLDPARAIVRRLVVTAVAGGGIWPRDARRRVGRPLTRLREIGARHAGKFPAVADVRADPVGRHEDGFEHLVAVLEREVERLVHQSSLDHLDQVALVEVLGFLTLLGRQLAPRYCKQSRREHDCPCRCRPTDVSPFRL